MSEEHPQPDIWEEAEQATFASDPAVRASLIQALARQPDAVMAALQQRRYPPSKKHQKVMSEVLRAIGYPRNAAALPILVAIATDPNAPGWEEATTTLREIGSEIVVPYLIEILWDRGQQRRGWDDEVYEVCWWLEQGAGDRAYLLGCGPMLAFLLSQKQMWKDLPEAANLEEALVTALIAIGPEGAAYVLPSLLAWLEHNELTDLGKQVQEALSSFESESLRPYGRVWPHAPR